MKCSEQVVRVLKSEGISQQELEYMVTHSAIKSTGTGHTARRYHNWLFEVKGDEVTQMLTADMTVIGHGREHMEEVCEECNGRGCHTCGWHGSVVRHF